MNNSVLIGRLTADCRSQTLQNGTAVAGFTLAVNRMKKGEADFIPCKAFGKTAEIIANYTNKGSLIAIKGNIRTGSYDKEGSRVYTFEVVVENIQLLGGTGQQKGNDPANNFGTYDDFQQVNLDEMGDIPF